MGNEVTAETPLDNGGKQPSLRQRGRNLRRTAKLYRYLERITEVLIYFSIIFAPWAFGSTNPWAIVTLNWAGLGLGLVWLAKICLRRFAGFRPHKWHRQEPDEKGGLAGSVSMSWPTAVLAFLNVSILGFCLVSAINAKGAFQYPPLTPTMYSTKIDYDNFLTWLPYSYDATATWWVFMEYLGLSFFFWAARDWLAGKTHFEIQQSMEGEIKEISHSFLTARMRRLIWIVCINGGLLAFEGILQKLSGTAKSLWISEPVLLKAATSQFGPWAYRSNGAAYVNLLWPVCLGFWWGLHKAEKNSSSKPKKVGQDASIVLIPCVIVMASSPFITSSRGGAVVALILIVAAIAIFLLGNRRLGWRWAAFPILVMTLALTMAGYLGFEDLAKRFEEFKVDETGGRAAIYRLAHKMADDAPVLGMGPGTFMSLSQFYRENITDEWAAMVHDDYLETRITFGWAGLVLIVALVPLGLAHVWFGRGISCEGQFIAMLWVAMGGCMVHAKFDFPFQIHSILLLFLTLFCIQTCLVKRA